MNQQYPINYSYPLSTLSQWGLATLGFVLVAFGQPAWIFWMAPIAAALGMALFWRVLLAYPSAKHRFWLATAWFFGVQLVQLSWFVSHPYSYIYGVYISLSLGMGLEFGIIALFIKPSLFQRVRSLLALAGLWTLLEWTRIFLLSGFSWNPIGLALTTNIYSLQLASLAGIFGLSFWVFFINLLALRAFLIPKRILILAWLFAIALPYLYGLAQISLHEHQLAAPAPTFKAVLVQTAFPAEEAQNHKSLKNPIDEVIDEWRQILTITRKHSGHPFDLMVLPEIVVPYGTYAFAFPLHRVQQVFFDVLGTKGLKALPSLQFPFSAFQKTPLGPHIMVNNAYWAQGLANYFQAGVVAGLEDAEDVANERKYYSAALFFPPQKSESGDFEFPARYEKRILLPMGEYIPFAFCRDLAAKYGVFGSFTCGQEAKVMTYNGLKFSPSICYEETFSGVTRETRQKGSELLVNLTSDVWYPNSLLPRQHFDLARLRTVENGFPLIRACNTGITAAIDSLGKIVAVLGDDHPEKVEWVADSLLVEVPRYTYWTLYSQFGDKLIVGISILFILITLTTIRQTVP